MARAPAPFSVSRPATFRDFVPRVSRLWRALCERAGTLAPPTPPVNSLSFNQSGGTMRLPMSLKDDPARDRGARGLVFRQPESHGLGVAARHGRPAGAGRIAAAAAGAAQFASSGAGRDRAVGHSRRRRSRRAAQLRRQGRQSGVADPAERRYRLDRLARPDRRDRRPGRVVAGDAADGNAERHGFAVGEGDRRGRRCARRPARRQCRQADRQRQHQEPQRQRRDQGQRRHHRRGRSSPRPGASSPIWRRRSISATPAFRWRARASTSRRRSSR